jgi:hypothetical protein
MKVAEAAKTGLAWVLFAGCIYGVFVSIFVPFELHRMASAQSWPSREGTITRTYVTHHAGGHRKPDYYLPEFRGRYTDTGEEFWISSVRYGDFRFGDGKRKAEADTAAYPAGARVQVYYDPNNPQETILEPHASWDTMLIMLGIGLGFLSIPFGIWLVRKVT